MQLNFWMPKKERRFKNCQKVCCITKYNSFQTLYNQNTICALVSIAQGKINQKSRLFSLWLLAQSCSHLWIQHSLRSFSSFLKYSYIRMIESEIWPVLGSVRWFCYSKFPISDECQEDIVIGFFFWLFLFMILLFIGTIQKIRQCINKVLLVVWLQ